MGVTRGAKRGRELEPIVDQGPLRLDRVSATFTGTTIAELTDALALVLSIRRASRLWIGDLLLEAERRGEDWQAVTAQLDDSENEAALDARRVCEAIPPADRPDTLTFGHLRAVYKLMPDERDRWLRQAVKGRWTVAQLRDNVHGRNGHAPDPGISRPTAGAVTGTGYEKIPTDLRGQVRHWSQRAIAAEAKLQAEAGGNLAEVAETAVSCPTCGGSGWLAEEPS